MKSDDRIIRDSWAEYERTGCTNCHLHRVLYPASRWPQDRPINWLEVIVFSVLGTLGALLGAWLVAR